MTITSDSSRTPGAAGLLRRLYLALPPGLRQGVMPLAHRLRQWIDPEARAHRVWLRDHYSRFGVQIREQVFLSIARFCHINRPIEGYYFEFGCHSARTMKLCWKHTNHLFDWTYVAFDSACPRFRISTASRSGPRAD
ncbi:MAG: hypothetical protein HY055_00760 [Magnetospirillum sp.]|nr:hypothetical protein [Magnetospirillum sp.]